MLQYWHIIVRNYLQKIAPKLLSHKIVLSAFLKLFFGPKQKLALLGQIERQNVQSPHLDRGWFTVKKITNKLSWIARWQVIFLKCISQQNKRLKKAKAQEKRIRFKADIKKMDVKDGKFLAPRKKKFSFQEPRTREVGMLRTYLNTVSLLRENVLKWQTINL